MQSRLLSSPAITSRIKLTARRMRIIRKKLSQNGLSAPQIKTIILQKILKVSKPTDSTILQNYGLSEADNRLATAIYTYLGQVTKTQTDALLLLDQFIYLLDSESIKLQLDIMQTSSEQSIDDQQVLIQKSFQQMQLIKAISTLKDRLSLRFQDVDFPFSDTLKMLKHSFRPQF